MRRFPLYLDSFKRDLPLRLLDDVRLKKIATAYGNVYMLPVLYDTTAACMKLLRVAHRNFVSLITQFHQRSSFWDPENNIYKAWNRYVYGRLSIPTLDTMVHNQKIGFVERRQNYVQSIRAF